MAAKVQRGYGTKLFGGRHTAEDLWIESLGQPCGFCGVPAATEFSTLVLTKDLQKHAPAVLSQVMQINPEGEIHLPELETVHGPAVCVGRAFACLQCTPQAERMASAGERQYSKRGLTTTVIIRRGPGKDKPVFSLT